MLRANCFPVAVRRLATTVIAVILIATPHASRAQATMPDSAARDSAYQRARALVLDGNDSAGRRIVDSLVVSAKAGSSGYADALYWRGTIAPTAADAERDYRRVIVDYPLSAHSGDALLALAQLEMARNDRESAIQHLDRFLLENPTRPERVRAGTWLGRLLIEQGDLVRGCIALGRAHAAVSATDVELRNQVEYQMARCASVDTTAAPASAASAAAPAKPTSVPPVAHDSSASSTVPNDSARQHTGPEYSVQVAAYTDERDANTAVRKLKARGLAARVTQSGRYYRVRIGRYATREEAARMAARMRASGGSAFVTAAEPTTP